MLLYAVPLLTGRLPEAYMQHLLLFVRAYELMLSWSLSREQVDEIQHLLGEWVEGLERLYVGEGRISMMTTNIHSTLHFADHIRDCGLVSNWSEWSLEDFVGAVSNSTKSRSKPDESLGHSNCTREMIKHASLKRSDLSFIPDVSFERMPKLYPSGTPRNRRGAYAIESGVLLDLDASAMQIYRASHLSVPRRRLMQQYFVDHGYYQLGPTWDLPQTAQLFYRYEIRADKSAHSSTGHLVGSQVSQRDENNNRMSNYVRFREQLHQQPLSEPKYGEVLYFVKVVIPEFPRRIGGIARRAAEEAHNAREERENGTEPSDDDDPEEQPADENMRRDQGEHYLALIQHWITEDTDPSPLGRGRRIRFVRTGVLKFIDLRLIDSLVGRLRSDSVRPSGQTQTIDWILTASSCQIFNPLED